MPSSIRAFLVCFGVIIAISALPAVANNDKEEIKWEEDGCKYEYKRDGNKTEKKYECDDEDDRHTQEWLPAPWREVYSVYTD